MLTELSFTRRKYLRVSSEPVFMHLISSGVDARHIVESDRKSSLRVSLFLTKPQHSKKWMANIVRSCPKGWSVSIRALEDKDWLTKWQKAFDVAPVGRKFVIVPLWKKASAKTNAKRTPLYVDPQGSFGSGTHATTRLIIETLETMKPLPGSFLDVGTGTGILLLAAGKLGIKELCGTDNDPRALKTAKHNLKLNGLKAKLLRADAISMKKLGAFDIVAANLLSKTLVDSRFTLAKMVKKSGMLLVSGIEKQNLKWFLKNFKVSSLKRRKVFVRGGWCAVLFMVN